MRPVALLAPGRGKTRRAYVWVYRTTNFALQRAVLYDFTLSRAGEHPRRVLEDFSGTLVTHDFRAITRCTPRASRPHCAWRTPAGSCLKRTSSTPARSPLKQWC